MLEEKVRHYEKGGIVAAQELQNAARNIERQNIQLRSWLTRGIGITDNDLQDWLKLPEDQAESCYQAFMLSRPIVNKKKSYNTWIDESYMSPPKCADNLGPIGLQFCSLLTLLSSPRPQEQSSYSCREIYAKLQHTLGGRISVEEVISRLMGSAVLATDAEGSYVDERVVKSLLASLGLEY